MSSKTQAHPLTLAVTACGAILGALLLSATVHAGRLTSGSGEPVMTGYGQCWTATGGTDAPQSACGDVVAQPASVKPAPSMTVEVVSAPTAATVTATVMQKISIGAAMLFAHDSADLSADARAVIDERIGRLRGNARLTSVMRVEGHTDSTGPEDYNLVLSQRRAQAVADYILARAPRLKAGDIEVVGFGESSPVASNATPEGRADNRRVVIVAEGEVGE